MPADSQVEPPSIVPRLEAVIPHLTYLLLEHQCLVPTVADLPAIGAGNGVRRWPQLTGERQAGRGIRTLQPIFDPITPPSQEALQPGLMLSKTQGHLDLLATGHPAMEAPAM